MVLAATLLRAGDVGWGDQARFAVTTWWTIGVPGAALAATALPSVTDRWTRWSLSFVAGLPVQLAGWFAAVHLGSWLLWAVPMPFAGWWLARRRQARPARTDASVPVTLARTLACGWWLWSLAAQLFATSPLPPRGGSWYPDLYWNLALSASATHSAPPHIPQVDSGTLDYHFFANAHVAAQSMASGVGLPVVGIRLWYLPVLAATVVLTGALAHRLAHRDLAAVAAIITLVIGQQLFPLRWFDPPIGSAFIPDSPSHQFVLPVLVVATWFAVEALRRPLQPSQWVVAALVWACLPGAKVSAPPVLLAGLVLACLSLWRRPQRRRAVLLVAAVGAITLGGTALFGGGGGGSVILLGATARQQSAIRALAQAHGYHETAGIWVVIAVGVLAVALAWLPTWLGLAVLWARRRTDPAVWLLTGILGSAQAVQLVLLHPSGSQLYFLRGVLPLAAVTVGWAGGELVAALRANSRYADWQVAVLGAVSLLVGMVGLALLRRSSSTQAPPQLGALIAWTVGLTVLAAFLAAALWWAWRHRSRSQRTRVALVAAAVGALVTGAAGQPFAAQAADGIRDPGAAWSRQQVSGNPTAAEVLAARWLGTHSPADALVATNVHCRNPIRTRPGCDARAFWPAALTERAMLVESWAYTDAGRQHVRGRSGAYTRPFGDPALLALNDQAFTSPTTAVLRQLRERGVSWLFADTAAGPVSPALDTLARVRLRSGTVTVYQLG